MTLIERAARELAVLNGHDPDEYWEDFDRNAAATVTSHGDYQGWEADVFPGTYRWQEYEPQARVLVGMVLDSAAAKAFEKSTHLMDKAADIGRAIMELKNEN